VERREKVRPSGNGSEVAIRNGGTVVVVIELIGPSHRRRRRARRADALEAVGWAGGVTSRHDGNREENVLSGAG